MKIIRQEKQWKRVFISHLLFFVLVLLRFSFCLCIGCCVMFWFNMQPLFALHVVVSWTVIDSTGNIMWTNNAKQNTWVIINHFLSFMMTGAWKVCITLHMFCFLPIFDILYASNRNFSVFTNLEFYKWELTKNLRQLYIGVSVLRPTSCSLKIGLDSEVCLNQNNNGI